MPRDKRIRLELTALAAALLVYCTVTAQSGVTTINLPLPSGATTMLAIFMALASEVSRRIMKRLDGVVTKCDEVKASVDVFKAEIRTAFNGIDGEGGFIAEHRALMSDVAELKRVPGQHARTGDVTPRKHTRATDEAAL